MILVYLIILLLTLMNSNKSETPTKIPPVYIAHGGGPLPLQNEPGHKDLVASLKNIKTLIPKPKAIVIISAHWEESVVTILENPNSDLLFDYYGFSDESYKYTYKAPYAENVNKRISELFNLNKIQFKKESKRGYDHGVFIPLLLMYPECDIPITQISLESNLDPMGHIKIGEALSELSNEGVLIIGSGLSFHNMRSLMGNVCSESIDLNKQFHNYLKDIFENSKYSSDHRIAFFHLDNNSIRWSLEYFEFSNMSFK